jgi:hypothetical protein
MRNTTTSCDAAASPVAVASSCATSTLSMPASRTCQDVPFVLVATTRATTGQLTVSVEDCRDFGWATTDGMLWHRLVRERGWSDEQFAEWLARLWVAAFVGPSGRARR